MGPAAGFLQRLEAQAPEFLRRIRRQRELIRGLTELYHDVRQSEKVGTKGGRGTPLPSPRGVPAQRGRVDRIFYAAW